jgi:phage-related minor tail protein
MAQSMTIDELNIRIAADSKNATRAINNLAKAFERLNRAAKPILNTNTQIAISFNKASSAAEKNAKSVKKSGDSAKKSATSFAQLKKNLLMNILTARTFAGILMGVANTMADMWNESNEYIETLNLFKVTMGDASDEALAFANNVSKVMGIDVADWMQYQGTFKNLTSGFGVASDKANIMSQNLTQLSYDLASFFNTKVETAFDKLSSAMAGQVKGLREFGIDTTVASLQEYALSKGIDATVRSMSQAEKSLLRYNYIMEKSVIMQGDMARTLVTPANALRILSAQFTQLKRAIGNVISVVAVKFIPYVQALVQIVTEAATKLANFFGFELPEIDYSSLGSGFSDEFEEAEDNLGGVSDKIKKIRKQLMGFDELNIINNPDTDSGGGSGGASVGGAGLDLKPLEYDFLKGLKTEKLDEIKSKLEAALKIAGAIGIAFGTWKIANGIVSVFNTFSALGGIAKTVGTVFKSSGIIAFFSKLKFAIQLVLSGSMYAKDAIVYVFKGINGVFSGLLLAVTGVITYFKNLFDMLKNGESVTNILGAAVGGLTASLGAFLIAIGVGATVATGGIAALVVGAVAAIGIIGTIIYNNWDSIKAWFSQTCEDIGQFFVGLWDGIVAVWTNCAEWFNTTVVTPVQDFFVGLWEGISQSASNCWQSVVEFFSPAIEWFSALFGSVWQTISDVFYNIGVIASGCWEIIKVVWGMVKDWFSVTVVQPVTTFFTNMWNGIKTLAISAWDGIKTTFSTIGNWINEKVIQPVSKFFSGLWDGFKEGAKKAWEGVKIVFSTVATFFKNIFTDAWKGIVKVFSVAGEIFIDIKNGVVAAFKVAVNGLIKGINRVVSIPFNAINDALTFLKNLEIVGIQPFKNLRSISVPQIPLLANGGVVAAGQMFIAREAGPELVGNIGRKTAVANNDQIISGIEAGVYRAMTAANSTRQGGSQTIRIINEIDGDVVGEKVIKYHNGQVMQTGVSPLLV